MISEEDSNHLLSCPFCGGEAEWINQNLADGHYYIRCSDGSCHVMIRADRRDKAIGFWNRRETESSLKEEIERLKKKSKIKSGDYFFYGKSIFMAGKSTNEDFVFAGDSGIGISQSSCQFVPTGMIIKIQELEQQNRELKTRMESAFLAGRSKQSWDSFLKENDLPVFIKQCICEPNEKHGETSFMCCNHCGLPIALKQ